MSYIKKWILFTLASVLVTLSCFAGVNYFMDPLWTFEHEHKYNQFQRGRKERQQKSNALYFRSGKYDTLLFGSSRTTYMNQYKWDKKTFNYAVSDMKPNEYNEYLNFAINEAKQPIKRVIIGLDFFGALTYTSLISKEPKLILDEITQPFYRYKLLLSIDTLSYSNLNIQDYFKKPYAKYKYNNIKTSPPKTDTNLENYEKRIQGNIETYIRERYSKKYDENYKKEILNLITSHPDIEFIVFTTPVSSQHFNALLSQNLYQEYERWLKESVEVFGKIHHFMYKNDITKNANLYFQDSNHGYDTTYECLTNEMLQKDSECPKIDMILNAENIEEKLNLLQKSNLD